VIAARKGPAGRGTSGDRIGGIGGVAFGTGASEGSGFIGPLSGWRVPRSETF
jgi:hypothetical protein